MKNKVRHAKLLGKIMINFISAQKHNCLENTKQSYITKPYITNKGRESENSIRARYAKEMESLPRAAQIKHEQSHRADKRRRRSSPYFTLASVKGPPRYMRANSSYRSSLTSGSIDHTQPKQSRVCFSLYRGNFGFGARIFMGKDRVIVLTFAKDSLDLPNEYYRFPWSFFN